jgi:hypothetical protein
LFIANFYNIGSPPPPPPQLHCKKRFANFPSPAGMSLTKLFLDGNNFPSRERLVNDIPAGDGKIVNLFFSVLQQSPYFSLSLSSICGADIYYYI